MSRRILTWVLVLFWTVPVSAQSTDLLALGPDGGGRLADWSGAGFQGGAAFPTGQTPTRTFAGDVTITQPQVLGSGTYWRCLPGAVIHIPVSLTQAAGPGTHGGTYGWTWDGAFFEIRDADGVLIEDCTVQFDGANKYQGHEGGERGYNAWGLYNAKNVYLKTTVLNADNAVFLSGSGTHHNTVELTAAHPARTTYYTTGEKGHYGVKLAGGAHENLIRATIDTRFFHDLSLTGNANLNVITGRGRDVNFDFHRTSTGAHHNLITDFDCGACARVFASSGPYKDGYVNSGPGNVWWGVWPAAGGRVSAYPNVGDGRFDPAYVFIGHQDDKQTATKEWLEAIAHVDLTPQNLYEYQRGAPAPPPPPSGTAQAIAWLKAQGWTDAMVQAVVNP